MSSEKGLNDVSKRHHVRIWKVGAWRKQELWIGAATRDIALAYPRPGQTLTPRIDENIDQERDRVRLLVTLARRRWWQNSVRESISNQFPSNNLQQSANLFMARPK
jgi:hypothetical protein